jgi:hypothetical protein
MSAWWCSRSSSLLSSSLALSQQALFFTQGRKVKITADDLPFFTHGNFRKGYFFVCLFFFLGNFVGSKNW